MGKGRKKPYYYLKAKPMKHIALFFSLLISNFSLSSQSLTAHDARVALTGASSTDAQILLNVIYWSYLRSETTTAVQDVLFDQLQDSWKLWLNSATTRRNPRTALPYPEMTQLDSTAANLALRIQTMVNATYIKALEVSIEQNSLIASAAVKEYIHKARAEVRTTLAHTMITSLIDLEKTFQTIHNLIEAVHSKKFIQDMQEITQKYAAEKNFLTDGIDYLIHGLAVQSFAQFDKKYLANSDNFFRMLAETQTMYTQVWQQLETTRAAYYKTLYTTVYTTMVDLGFPSSSFLCMFDEQGLISPEQQTTPLSAVLI